jgi:hypothetical protein
MRRPVAALGLCTALFLGGGTSLVLVTFPDGSASADTSTLGGYTVNSLAEPITVQYEQPNFPLPATPSLEFDVGYAASTDNVGSGSATASTFYPGQVVANAGPQLSLLLPGVPLPAAPVWPLQAVTDYPQAPNNASLDEPGANMDASSSADSSTATATLGDDAANAGASGSTPTAAPTTGNPLAASSSLIGIGTASGTSSSGVSDTASTGSASSTVGGISLLGGFINIGTVTSTATASSDGTTGTLTGATVVSNMTIAGEQVTISGSGISAAGKSEPLALPLAAINTLLGELGISMKVTSAVDSIQNPMATRTLDGLQISINLDTLDTAANKGLSLLPASLTSQLPVALPNQQVITIDLATVTVSAAASPSYVDSDTGSATAPDDSSGSSGFTPSTGSSDTGSGTFGGSTGGSTFGTGSTATTPSATTSAPTSGTGGTALASAPAVFKGIGSALILLGVLAALAMAYAYKRADDASELLGTSCADGDPLGSRFSDEGDDADEVGDFA